jgi:hypothetical protein
MRVGRRVRVKTEDFERLVNEGYTGRSADRQPTIWDGHVPEPREPWRR